MSMIIRNNKRSFLLTLVVGAIMFCGVISTVESADVLIATERSRFKNVLVEQLVERFEGSGYAVTVIDHTRELDNQSDRNYDAIVIINAGVNSRVRPWVTQWLEGVSDTGKIILVTTYRDKGWQPIFPQGVDSITTPSRRNKVGELVTDIGQKVDSLL